MPSPVERLDPRPRTTSVPARRTRVVAALFALGLLGPSPAEAGAERQQPAPDATGPHEVRVETLVYAEAPADSAPGGTLPLRMDLYRPDAEEASAPRPAVVLLHGGAFVGGRRDLAENRELASTLASRGYAVASIEYRLWPDRPVVAPWVRDLADRVSDLGLPLVERMEELHGRGWTTAVGAAAEDALRAIAWLRSHGPDHGVDPRRIALGGMSAGGLTALEVAHRVDPSRVELPELSAVVVVRGAWLLAPEEATRVLRPDGPPLFVVHGSADDRVPFEEAVRLYRAARAADVPVAFHPLAGVDHDDPESGGADMLRVRLDDGSLLADRLDRFLAAAFADTATVPASVCVAAGGACPETGREPGDDRIVGEELGDRAAALVASVAEEAGFVEELMGYRRAEELMLGFDHPSRRDWSYWPRPRAGLALGRMTASQRSRVQDVLASVLSPRGYLKVAHVMRFEDLLEDRETVGFRRGAENYTTTIFGRPDEPGPWALRFEGHHLSLNVTVSAEGLRVTPTFLGISPASLAAGPHAGFRPLRFERDLARELLLSLRPEQAARALVSDSVPGDVLSSPFGDEPERRDDGLERLRPDGVPSAGFDAAQRRRLRRLLDQVVGDYRPEIAASYREAIELDDLRFAWMGSTRPGAPQYFRLQGPSFVFEFDASQEGGDHVHTVWRDREGDFGEDVLRRHHREHHR